MGIGLRHTELSLMLGTLYTTEQALRIGMVDEMVADRAEALSAAHRVASQLARIPREARHISKMMMRQPTLEKLTMDKQADIDLFCKFIVQPQIQKPIGLYLEALKKKSSKK